jgi:succinate dehydrogenase/fumarate reductase cytochrome b subunit
MQVQTRFWSRLGGLAIVYAVLFVLANVLLGSTPSTGKSGADVVNYYRAHKGSEIAGVFVLAVAAVAFTFFLAAVRRALSRSNEGHQLATIVTAGGAVYVVGLLTMAAVTVALVDAGHYRMVTTAQTLNVLGSDDWVPVVVGLSLIGLGAGVAGLRTAALPRWLSWISIVFGIISLAGPLGEIAFLAAPVWAILVGVTILRTKTAGGDAADPARLSYSPAST